MLPAVRTDEEWQAVVFDEKTVRPAAEDLAARLGLTGAALPVATPELVAHGEYENGTATCLRASASSRPRPSPPWIPWP